MSNDLIADLVAMGMSNAQAWQVLNAIDRITDGVPREVAEDRLRQFFEQVVARRFGRNDGRERLVPPGFERT